MKSGRFLLNIDACVDSDEREQRSPFASRHVQSHDFQMFSSRLYWFFYRRRNRLLLAIATIFFILSFLYLHDSPSSSSSTAGEQSRRVRSSADRNGRGIRVNRDTYTTPEPCRGCPGENGQGVQLTVTNTIDRFGSDALLHSQPEESKGLDEVLKKEFFNLRASEKISLWRSVPDTRDAL